ncbi:outer membrane protein assembly factor BamD [Yeosuana aromativorans]|uniref:Outer membrane protein assembly factor BamD n=1 Tax=Yeosuana aromativorans TaxID=288019 RepID=A0A8J3BF82_9FLAO|nr:outer membrane protein assembly factor BamD [Yeosuana aromativorans]GGK15240.1 outer membrane protein assembly factor BamD [Yeosuana aromativorans]
MKKFIYIVLVLGLFSSCSEYQKALKSEDTATKFKLGQELYDSGKFEKANKLFAQIVPDYRGKPQAEKLMYLYSQTFYKMKDYYVAGYQFERFASSYPKSEKVDEASFLAAKSNYMLSPVYSKDQTETKKAIEKLQEFINLYPESEYLPEANKLVKELDYKLEKKAFEIAKQYDRISDYEASIKSFDNFIFDFPGSTLREDALFYKLDASYKLAINSVEYKKQKRLHAAELNAETFIKSFADSKYMDQVNDMLVNIKEQLKNYSTKANT